MNYAIKQPEPVGRMMTDPNQRPRPVVKSPPSDQITVSAAQLQHMQAQMAAMQAQIQAQEAAAAAQRQPVARTYSIGQVQILLACETINSVMEEFDLSSQKQARLILARDYLLSLGELSEFIQAPNSASGSTAMGVQEQELDQMGGAQPISDEELFEEPEEGAPIAVEQYPGQTEKSVKEEINQINLKMAELKKDEQKQDQEKAMTGIEKIKAFVSRKNVANPNNKSGDKKNYDKYEGVPEGMG